MPNSRRLALPTLVITLAVSALASRAALAQTDTTTTAQILANTVSAAPSCASWRVSGTCFWLHCTFWSCSVKTSMRVSHYNPDAVVSTFHEDVAHPWTDWGVALSRSLRSTAAGLVGVPVDSAGTRTRDDRRDRSKMYRDADVIGHPTSLLSLLGSSGTFTMLCPTEVRAFQPYLSSYIDALVWRAMLPIESLYPAALVPGLREIGAWPLNSWSAVYPRDGNVTQQHPVKGAAVLSQRAGDITTRLGQPHVYVPLPTGGRHMVGNTMVWLPPPLVERDISTGKWQMLAPLAQRSCEVFGGNDSILPVSWGDGRTSSTGGYAFNLWRPYSCCSRAGQIFLGAVTF